MTDILARCNIKTIASGNFCNVARCYPIRRMRTVAEIRHANLLLLLSEYGSLVALNEKLGLPRTDATLSQIKNRNISSRGKPRNMGSPIARRIEFALQLGAGWMDHEHPEHHGADGHRISEKQSRINQADKIMEHMDVWQLDQALKILDTLAQPAPPLRSNSH